MQVSTFSVINVEEDTHLESYVDFGSTSS